jgi:thioredoxin reductase
VTPRPRLAVLGAGPIGLECALAARTLGFPVTVYEAGTVGSHPAAWGHVRLFTPWSLNVSGLARTRLARAGAWDVEANVCPTGSELVARYLEPLASLPDLAGAVRERRRVIAIGRGDRIKRDPAGDRTAQPFRLLLDAPAGEETAEADAVIDATGVFGQPNALGRGGIPAPGERASTGWIERGLPDVMGRDRARFEGRRVLVAGGGLSAATTVVALASLPGTRTLWATRRPSPPLHEIPGDPLPSRVALIREANGLAADPPSGFQHLGGFTVSRLAQRGGAIEVGLEAASERRTVRVDRIVSQTGFHPDASIHRELQVHACYASEGPMRLAAALDGGPDCMAQTGHGPESLLSPEPGFFIAGHKAYGRNPSFLLRIGHEQVRDIFRLLTGDRSLELDGSPALRA